MLPDVLNPHTIVLRTAPMIRNNRQHRNVIRLPELKRRLRNRRRRQRAQLRGSLKPQQLMPPRRLGNSIRQHRDPVAMRQLVAQFLGWTEAIREEIQFLDHRENDLTKRFRELQDSIYTTLQTDKLGPGFRLFAGEQRAVGELMIDRTSSVCRCRGYADFVNRRDPNLDYWLDPVRDDIKQMAHDLFPFEERLIRIQHAMIDLLEFLDPQFIRFPRSSRAKVQALN